MMSINPRCGGHSANMDLVELARVRREVAKARMKRDLSRNAFYACSMRAESQRSPTHTGIAVEMRPASVLSDLTYGAR